MAVIDQMVGRVLAAAFAQPEPMTVSRWADAYREVSARFSSAAGRWNSDLVPFTRGPMDAIHSPSVFQVTIKKCEQVGCTEVLFNQLMYIIDRTPGPTMFVYPSQDIAREVNRKRLMPSLKATRQVARHFTGRAYDEGNMSLTLDRMDLMFRGAGKDSERNLEGTPCKHVIVDELDRCLEGGDIIPIVSGRLTTYRGAGGKLIANGRPGMAGIGIDKEYTHGDRREYWVPCPRCGQFHVRKFGKPGEPGGVRWLGGKSASEDEVRQNAWFECPHCHGRIEGHENLWQLLQGVWLRDGESIESDGRIVSCDPDKGPALSRLTFEEVRGEEGTEARRHEGTEQDLKTLGVKINSIGPEGSHASFHISGLLHARVANPYGWVAGDFVKAGCRATGDWVTRRLGEAWTVKGEEVMASELAVCVKSIEEGGYSAGIAPLKSWNGGPGPVACLCVVDVQKNGAWWAVIGYGPAARDKWLLDFGYTLTSQGGNLAELDFLFDLALPMDGPEDRYLAPRAWAIDYHYRPSEVIEFCLRGRAAGKPSIPVIGRVRMMRPWELHPLEKYPGTNKPIPNGLPLLNVDTGYYKERIMAAVGRQKDPEACMAAGFMFMPDRSTWNDAATAEMYMGQVTAEKRIPVEDKSAIRLGSRPNVSYEWRKKPGVEHNHALDLNVYADAMADAAGWRKVMVRTERVAAGPVERAAEKPAWRGNDTARRDRMAAVVDRMRARTRDRTAARR